MAWTVQSIPTMTESGHEMGSLHIEESLAASLPTGFTRAELQLDTFVLAHIKIGTASESGITSECAVALLDTSEKELAIATAPATGAVAVLLPGQPWPATEFSPSGIIWAAI